MIIGLKQLTNLSIPQTLIKTMIGQIISNKNKIRTSFTKKMTNRSYSKIKFTPNGNITKLT